jgi:hypothetical protein
MRVRNYLGFPILAAGLSGVVLGHHLLGLTWFWIGVVVTSLGLTIVMNGGLQEKMEEALRSYRGPGDFGDRHYHGGPADSGADGGGGD